MCILRCISDDVRCEVSKEVYQGCVDDDWWSGSEREDGGDDDNNDAADVDVDVDVEDDNNDEDVDDNVGWLVIRRESRRHVREERTDRRCMEKQKAKQICKSKYKFCIVRRAESRRLPACGIDGKFPGEKRVWSLY